MERINERIRALKIMHTYTGRRPKPKEITSLYEQALNYIRKYG